MSYLLAVGDLSGDRRRAFPHCAGRSCLGWQVLLQACPKEVVAHMGIATHSPTGQSSPARRAVPEAMRDQLHRRRDCQQ